MTTTSRTESFPSGATKDSYQIVPTTRAERTSWALNQELKPGLMVALIAEADATKMSALRNAAKEQGQVAPSYTAFVIRAAAQTLAKHPEANRAILGPPLFRKLVQFKNIDIGIAVERGLPSLPGLAYAKPIQTPLQRTWADVTLELQHLVKMDESNDPGLRQYMRLLRWIPRPLSNWILSHPLWFPKAWIKYRGCAAWVNSPARHGADLVMCAWPWPITFSFGRVCERPTVVDGKVEAGLTMPILMEFDRRLMGGGPASRIFADFKEFLENPSES